MTYPDNWVVIKMNVPEGVLYKVLAGWSGGYTTGDSWQLNSGVVSVRDAGEYLSFMGHSGSEYICHKESYGLKMNNAYVWNEIEKRHGDKVELMDENTDWLNIEWNL